MQRVENDCRIRDTADMGDSLEQMARSLVESGDYRVTSRLGPQAEYHPPDSSPKLMAAVVDVETTGTNPDSDRMKIPVFRSHPRSRTLPALPIRWSPVTASTSEPSTIC
jgi:hypothetical protein